MTVLVYETDIGVYLNNNAKLKNITFKAGAAMISIEIDKVTKLQGTNAVLAQSVADKCWPKVKAAAPELMKALKALDAETDAKKRDPAVDKAVEKFSDDLADDLIKVATSTFTGFGRDKKDYKKYKIKQGVKIAINGSMLAVSIGITAAAGWTGVGTVVGVVGMVRSAASLGQQIANLFKDANTIYLRIDANIEKLKKQLASPSVKANTAKQVGATVLNKVFAIEIESIVVTVAGVEGDFQLLSNKIKGNKVNAVALAKQIPKLLDLQSEVAALEKLEKLGTLDPAQTADLKKLRPAMKKVEEKTANVVESVYQLMATIDKVDAWTTTSLRDIVALKSKYSANAVKVASVATDCVLAVSSFAAGNWSNPAETLKDLETASKVVVTSLALTNDALGTLKDTGVSVYDAVRG